MVVLLVLGLIVVASFSVGLAEKAVHPKVLPVVSSAASMPPDVEWERMFGGPVDSVSWVIQTSDGGYALVGYIGSGQVRLIKTDVSGNMQWNQTYEAYSVETVVQVRDGGYVLACNTGGEALLVKTDSEGHLQWNKSYSGGMVNAMVLTADEGYLLAGRTEWGGGSYTFDFWLTKVDKNGKLQWSKTYGGEGGEEALSVIQTGDGGYAVAGYTDSFGSGGRPAHYSNIDIRYNFWLVKINSAGDLQWSRTFGETGDNRATSLVQTDDGGYVVAGVTAPPGLYGYVSWLIKTDSLGRAVWNKTYGVLETVGPGDVVNSLIRTSDGGFAFAGSALYHPAHDSKSRFWLVKTDSVGELEWNQTYGKMLGLINTWDANCLVQTCDGGLALLGSGKMGGSRNTEYNYFYLVKTESFLPPPTPFPPPEQPPSTPESVPSLVFPTTTIRGDGSVDPSTAPIQRDGNVYTFTGNLNGPLVIEKDGIVVDGAGYALLGNGTIAGLYIRVSGTGINLTGRKHVTIKGLTVEQYLTAISLSNCSYITLEGNTVRQNDKGIYVFGTSPTLKISDNVIQANDHYGIWLRDVEGSLISGNTIRENSHFGGSSALVVISGSNNTIVGNVLEEGVDGISLARSMNNTVVANHIANHYMAGIDFRTQGTGLSLSHHCEDNMIYLNNFINNTVALSDQVDDHNFWDNSTFGNYWNVYGTRDFIPPEVEKLEASNAPHVLRSVEGTSSRPLSPANTDHYPLVYPVSSSQIQALRQTLEQEWDLQQPLDQNSDSNVAPVDATSIAIVVTVAVVVIVFLAAVVLRTRKTDN